MAYLSLFRGEVEKRNFASVRLFVISSVRPWNNEKTKIIIISGRSRKDEKMQFCVFPSSLRINKKTKIIYRYFVAKRR